MYLSKINTYKNQTQKWFTQVANQSKIVETKKLKEVERFFYT